MGAGGAVFLRRPVEKAPLSTMASTHSKVAVSAPSLNVYHKISVIRQPNDRVTYEDAEGNAKSLSIKELGDAIATAVRAVD